MGQDQDSVGGDLDAEQSFSGKIGYFNAWDRALSVDEIKSIQNCSIETNGNVVAWNGVWQGALVTRIRVKDHNKMCFKKIHFPEMKQKLLLLTMPSYVQ